MMPQSLSFFPETPQENPFCWGHDQAKNIFLNSFQKGRLAHGWLLVGPEGVGKRTLAYQMIRLLLSHSPDFETVEQLCPQSPLFRRIAAHSHGDLWVVEPENATTPVPAEQMRQIKTFLQKTPAEGGWRVVLIDGVDGLNAQGANAILKILEAPPPHTLLLLTAQTLGGVLPTLRSRCQVLTLHPFSDAHLIAGLQRLGFAKIPKAVLFHAHGCLGQAIHWLKEERWTQAHHLHNTLIFACLPKDNPQYQPFCPADPLQSWMKENPQGSQLIFLLWVQHLLLKGGSGHHQQLSALEQTIFHRYSLATWWSIWDKITDQFGRGLALHLDPVHVFTCAIGILAEF